MTFFGQQNIVEVTVYVPGAQDSEVLHVITCFTTFLPPQGYARLAHLLRQGKDERYVQQSRPSLDQLTPMH